MALMPFNAIAHRTYVGILTYLGRPCEALTAFDEEAKLAPRAHRQFFTLAMRAQAHVMLGELEKVLRATDAALNDCAGHFMLPLIKAICMTALVRTEGMREAVLQCRKIGVTRATPDGYDRACRRLFSPEAFVMFAPAIVTYRKAWDATPSVDAP